MITLSIDTRKLNGNLKRNPKIIVAENEPRSVPQYVTAKQQAEESAATVAAAAPIPAATVPASSTTSADSVSAEDIEKVNSQQLAKAMQLLTASPSSSTSSGTVLAEPLPSDAVPDAADVDVSGAEDGTTSGTDSQQLTEKLIRMMEEGQTFLFYQLQATAPRRVKIFYR